MSIFLTQIGSDNFNRAPENPLSQGGNWTRDSAGDVGLQIVSAGICENAGSSFQPCGELYSGVPLPNDQYVSATFAAAPTNYGQMNIYVRLVDNGTHFPYQPCYQLQAYNLGGSTYAWALYSLSTSLGSGSITIHAGDVFTLAVIGTTVYAYQNSTLLISVTNATYSSGIAALGQIWYTSGPSESQVSDWVVGSASLTPPATAGPTATLTPAYGPRPIFQIFGVISSGAHAGAIAACAADANGNLAISGGSGGSINTLDLLGSLADAVPAMIYGATSGSTVPGSTALVAAAVDNYGNLLCSIGTGGGSPSTTVDKPTACFTGVTPCQVFARDPAGNIVGVPAASNGALGDTINPITNVSAGYGGIDELTTDDGELPIPVVLCGRIAAGYPNAGAIIAVSLDPTGALCVSGSSGSSTTPSAVLTFKNGQPALIQLYGRTSAGTLTSVPLTSAGSLFLN